MTRCMINNPEDCYGPCPCGERRTYAHGDPCPDCGKPMGYEPATSATRNEPGSAAFVACDDCGVQHDVSAAPSGSQAGDGTRNEGGK